MEGAILSIKGSAFIRPEICYYKGYARGGAIKVLSKGKSSITI